MTLPSPYIWDSTTTVKRFVQRYVNQFVPWFSLSPYDAGLNQDIKQTKPHSLEINSLVIGEQLQFAWNYSCELYESSTIEAITKNFLDHPTDLII